MEQKRTLGSWISARRYIRDFAADYAARHGENAAEIEKDILQAKKRNHISLNEYEWVGYHDRTEAQKRTMSTLWTRAEFRKNFTDRRYIAILMNKYIFSKVFSDFYGRRCVQASAVDAALLRSRAAYMKALAQAGELPPLNSDALTALPGIGQSTAQVIHNVDERAGK